MSTSGTYTYSRTAAQIITRVAKNLGILGAGATINSDDQTDLLETLNLVAKELQGTADGTRGLKLSLRQRITLFLAQGQSVYSIGPASTDARATTSYGRTTVATAYASGTSLVVAASSDTTTFPGTTVSMANSDIIGVVLDDGTLAWTTVSSISGSPTITLAAGLASAASVGNYVYWFTSRAQRFTDIDAAVLRTSSMNDTELYIYKEVAEYEIGVPSKHAEGEPSSILVEPLRISTRLTLDSLPTDVTKQIVLTVLYPAENYDSVSNDVAFPQEWLGRLEWETTLRACPMYSKKWTTEMDANLKMAVTRSSGLNPENSTLYFQPNP